MTIRAAIDRPLDPLRPDGRWARLLKALERGPLDPSQLFDAIDQGRYPRWRERRKIVVALHAMASLGLTAATHYGWVRTVTGAAALQALASADEPERRSCAG